MKYLTNKIIKNEGHAMGASAGAECIKHTHRHFKFMYARVGTHDIYGILFCLGFFFFFFFDFGIQVFKNLFWLNTILDVLCVFPKEWVLFDMVLW